MVCDLVSSQKPLWLSNQANLLAQPFSRSLHRDIHNLNLHAWLLEPQLSEFRASLIKWQVPQRCSTRTVYEAKWTNFGQWCQSHQVGFQTPSINHVADFPLYLLQKKKHQPSSIDGDHTAIVDKVGNSSMQISKDENLTQLLDSFHRDRPFMELIPGFITSYPRLIRQEDWSEFPLYSPDSSPSKNQLAREGPDSVAPMVIPALPPPPPPPLWIDPSKKTDPFTQLQRSVTTWTRSRISETINNFFYPSRRYLTLNYFFLDQADSAPVL